MDRIYGRALLTIVAAGGVDANAGLPGVGTHPRSLEPFSESCNPELKLLKLQQTCDYARQRSEWNARAWTYQERILSRRCLVFVGNTVSTSATELYSLRTMLQKIPLFILA